MTVLHFNKFYADKHAVDEAVKKHAANNSYEPQDADDDGLDYQRKNWPLPQNAPHHGVHCGHSYEPQHVPDLPLDGVEYVSTRQMAWACAVLFVVIVAVSFLPISI